MISILDPESSLLPDEVRFNWDSTTDIYELSRNYVYNIHKKIEKFYEKTSWSLHSSIRDYTIVQVMMLVTEMSFYNFAFC
jgi:hypothetical protein